MLHKLIHLKLDLVAKTNVLKYSFVHRITDQWNQLPLEIRVSDNVNIFKSVSKVCIRAKWPIRLELIPVSVA